MGQLKKFLPKDHPLADKDPVLEALDEATREITQAIANNGNTVVQRMPRPKDHSADISALSKQIAEIEIPKVDLTAVTTALALLARKVDSIPQADLTMVMDSLKMIADKLDEPMEMDMPVQEKKRYKFDFEYDAITGDIVSAEAVEV